MKGLALDPRQTLGHSSSDVARLEAMAPDPRPLVSIIMIFLNAERFMQEAIESIFAQTYRRWDLVLVDDGSTDGSTRTAMQYAERLPGQIRYLEHPEHRNRGMSASRNLGIRHSTGPYVAFLDADDVWLPDKLERQVAILYAQPDTAMVYGPVTWWYGWTQNPEDRQRDHVSVLGELPNTLLHPPKSLLALLRRDSPRTTNSLVRRTALEAVGGFDETFRGLYEDSVLFAKLCIRAPVYVADDCWYKWRKHADSHCSVALESGQYYAGRAAFLTWLSSYLSTQRVNDRDVWRLLRREAWRCKHYKLSRLLQHFQHPRAGVAEGVKGLVRRVLPTPLRVAIDRYRGGTSYIPPVGEARLGDFERITPVSRQWGFDRGLPVDRYYIERFLAGHASDIQGRTLEIGDDVYTRQFGDKRVSHSDVLHAVPGNPKATIVADLVGGDQLPSSHYDCIICTQTLQFIYDLPAALRTLHRMLKPGGVLLVTLPGISKMSIEDMARWGEYWRFTRMSSQRLLTTVFPPASVTVDAYGNVGAAVAFLHGLAAEELRKENLNYADSEYEVLITVRAIKPQEDQGN
jgi:glycosyltransferase involved in cell wall biosynthesis